MKRLSRKLNELDAEIDDAKTAVEELQTSEERGASAEKLDEILGDLEQAADTLDDFDEKDDPAV